MGAVTTTARLQYVITELRPGTVRWTDLILSIVREEGDEDDGGERRAETAQIDGSEADDELSDEREELNGDDNDDESDEEDDIDLMFARFRNIQEDESWRIYRADGLLRNARRGGSRWPGGTWIFR